MTASGGRRTTRKPSPQDAASSENLTEPDTRIAFAHSVDELRSAAEDYREQATELCNSLIKRGEAALERLPKQRGFEGRWTRAERAFHETIDLTQQALANIASHSRAMSEQAAELIDREAPARGQQAAAPAKRTR